MNLNDEYILTYFYGKKHNKLNKKLLINIPQNINEYLLNRYNDSTCIEETLQRIKLNIDKHPICECCGKLVKYVGSTRFFLKSCGDIKCTRYVNKLHQEQTCLKKYGVTNTSKLEDNKIKRAQTNLKKYGCECVLQNETVKEKTKQTNLLKYNNEISQQSDIVKMKIKESNLKTCLERYGISSPSKLDSTKEKIKQTCLERYGVTNVGKVTEIREKTKQTILNKYGIDSYSKTDEYKEKIKQTCLEQYGVEHYSKANEYKEKIKQLWLNRYNVTIPFQLKETQIKSQQTKLEKYGDKNYSNREKSKQTCLNRYGVENYCKTKECKDYLSKLISSKEVQNKINTTKKQNNSYNKSQPEDECYNILKEYFPDVIRQYTDERYPFNCDFYIPSKDLFIEYNGSQYHQGHPFNENDKNDIKILEELKSKANNSNRHEEGKKSQYDNMIETWTIRDVKKRNIAKQNKLNYIELWNLNELERVLNN